MHSLLVLGLSTTPSLASDMPEPVTQPVRPRLSAGYAVLTGVGITSGVLGVTSLGLAAAALQSPEPYGAFFFAPAGAVLLTGGTVLGMASSWAQARRIGASPRLAQVGGVLLGAGVAVGLIGIVPNEGAQWVAGIGASALGTVGFGLVVAQGMRNVNHVSPRVAVLPQIGRRQWGLTLAASW